MYKSLIGAIGLFGLLLALCSFTTPIALAESALGHRHLNSSTITSHKMLTESVVLTSALSELYTQDMVAKNQIIVKVITSNLPIVITALQDNAFAAETIYQGQDGITYILATKKSDSIRSEAEDLLRKTSESYFPPNAIRLFGLNIDSPNATLLAETQPSLLIGSPHSIGAVPFGIPLIYGSDLTHLVYKQWALTRLSTETFGIDLYDGPDFMRAMTATGKGVRIVLFDTSPFTFIEDNNADGVYAGIFTTPLRIGTYPTLTIRVTNISATQPYTTPDVEEVATRKIDISSHGLFAASLVYAVAPDAQIELIQVLDSRGLGVSGELVKQLSYLITSTQNSTMPVVVNLSLGVLPELEHHEPEADHLLQPISDVFTRGIAVVASAGNLLTMTEPITMQIPANYPNVIGVGASNAAGGIACFSKYKKTAGYGVIAPGGDANFDSTPDNCLPKRAVQRCKEQLFINTIWIIIDRLLGQKKSATDIDNCSDMLIGLTYNPQTGEYHYGYWMGTSFAAPIVSGLIALELEQGKTRDEIYEMLRVPQLIPKPRPNAPAQKIDCPQTPIKHLVIRSEKVSAC